MINLPIGRIIQDAFRMAWRYKYLWLFGLFAGSGAGGMNTPGGGGEESGIPDIDAARAAILGALALIIMIGFVVIVVMMILHVICKSALIYNVYQIETGGAHSISGGWDFGRKRFWPMLGLTLVQAMVAIVFFFVLAVIGIMFFAIATPLGFLSLLFLIPIGLMGIVLFILLWNYAELFLTLEMRGVFDALGDAWLLIRDQWKPSALMLLAKFLIALGVLVIVGIGGFGLALMTAGLWVIAKPLAILFGVVVLLPIFVLISAYFGVFDYAVWTKTFLQLRAPAYARAESEPSSGSSPDAAPGGKEPPPRPSLFE